MVHHFDSHIKHMMEERAHIHLEKREKMMIKSMCTQSFLGRHRNLGKASLFFMIMDSNHSKLLQDCLHKWPNVVHKYPSNRSEHFVYVYMFLHNGRMREDAMIAAQMQWR